MRRERTYTQDKKGHVSIMHLMMGPECEQNERERGKKGAQCIMGCPTAVSQYHSKTRA